MRHLLLIVLTTALTMSVACSKKKSSAVATAPPAVTDPNVVNNNYYITGLPAPVNSQYHYGTVNISQRATYVNFLKAAFGYQAYNNGGYFGEQQGYSYNYNYTCDLNIFRWIRGDSLVDCDSYQDEFARYIDDLSKQRTMVQFLFKSDGTAKGLWLAGAYQDFNGTMYAYEQIPFQGRVIKLQDGRFMIEAGPLVFLTTTSVSNFDVFFEEARFGNVNIR